MGRVLQTIPLQCDIVFQSVLKMILMACFVVGTGEVNEG